MKKIYIFTIICLLFAINNSNAFTYGQTSDLDPEGPKLGEGYQTVQIYCDENQCWLYCSEIGGQDICSFDGATWCHGCLGYQTLFSNAQGQDMFDYANQKVDNGVYTGSYTNNLTVGPKTYYRTITWSANIQTLKMNAELEITE